MRTKICFEIINADTQLKNSGLYVIYSNIAELVTFTGWRKNRTIVHRE